MSSSWRSSALPGEPGSSPKLSGARGSERLLSGHSFLSHLECSGCGRRHDADLLHGRCDCGHPLLARYDLAAVRAAVTPTELAGRRATLWRYHELLPVRDPGAVVSLDEGLTPVVQLPRQGAAVGIPGLLVKDDGRLPTGSFKGRGAAVGVSRAAELGVRGVALATNGNAGAAWTAYAARAGLRALVAVPRAAPPVPALESRLCGAELIVVDGLIGDAARVVANRMAAAGPGWLNAATLGEPYRVEGKKTIGLELVEQLGWRPPDVVVFPTGGGVGVIGIHKAMLELGELGWLQGPPPRLVVAQAAGCAPLVRAFRSGERDVQPWPEARTVAFGINVPQPPGAKLVLDALAATGGTAFAVTDEELLAERVAVARNEGLLVCPEGAAALAVVRRLRVDGWLTGQETVVVVNTAAASRYPLD